MLGLQYIKEHGGIRAILQTLQTATYAIAIARGNYCHINKRSFGVIYAHIGRRVSVMAKQEAFLALMGNRQLWN